MDAIEQQRRKWLACRNLGWIIAIGSPLVGLAITITLMNRALNRAFWMIDTSGFEDPSRIVVPIGEVLIPTAMGVIGFLGGGVLVIVARRRLTKDSIRQRLDS